MWIYVKKTTTTTTSSSAMTASHQMSIIQLKIHIFKLLYRRLQNPWRVDSKTLKKRFSNMYYCMHFFYDTIFVHNTVDKIKN